MPNTVTREHRAEAAHLHRHCDRSMLAHHYVEWIETGERDEDSPHYDELAAAQVIAQALADRDARIGELEAARKAQQQEEWRLNDALEMRNDQLDVERALHDTTKAQLARVVGALRKIDGEECGCVFGDTRAEVYAILKEFEDAK